jgi:F0F1-type ATP synthase assembly protein I
MAIRKPRSPVTAWGQAFEVAFEVGLAVILGVLIGNYLDGRFETSPLFLFVFLALGFATGVRRLLGIRWPGVRDDKNKPQDSDRKSGE